MIGEVKESYFLKYETAFALQICDKTSGWLQRTRKNTRKKFSKKKKKGRKEVSNKLRATAQDKRQTKRQDRG